MPIHASTPGLWCNIVGGTHLGISFAGDFDISKVAETLQLRKNQGTAVMVRFKVALDVALPSQSTLTLGPVDVQ